MLCAICHTRKAKRACPGVRGDICSVCCAEGREETIDCPLGCEYLVEAHLHERTPDIDPSTLPNQDIEVTEEFLQANEFVLAILAIAIYEAVLDVSPATDWDLREAFEALIRTWRTSATGLVYESKPDNLYAAQIASRVKERIEELRQREMEATGSSVSSLKDSSVLAVLVFLQRLEYAHNNGRKRSRAFIDFLARFYAPPEAGEEAARETEEAVEIPDAPRVIL